MIGVGCEACDATSTEIDTAPWRRIGGVAGHTAANDRLRIGVHVTPDTQAWTLGSVRLLWHAAVAWLAVCALTGVVGMVAVYEDTSLVRIEEFSRLYRSVGLGDEIMITALLALPLAFAIGSAGVILLRKPNDPAAILMAVGLVSVYFFTSGAAQGVQYPLIRHGSVSMAAVLIVVFLTVFPSGRYEPRWSIVAPLLAVAIVLADPTLATETRSMLSDADFRSAPASVIKWAAWSLLLTLAAAAQIHRYRSHSTDRQRRQSRWVLLGVFGLLTPPAALLVLRAGGLASAELTAGLVVSSIVGSFALPVVVLIAVFRHHLYDIDRIVSRTVTYALVAAVVTTVYAIPVLVLPRLLDKSNDLVIAASTLGAAAVFNPVRRRIQRGVDHRFNRARYDAEREVDALSSRLEDAVDLTTVTDDLSRVLDRTVSPVHRAVWIRTVPAGQEQR